MHFQQRLGLQQSKMNTHNIPKRKKNPETNNAKRSQSEQQILKTSKRKTPIKKIVETQCSSATLARTLSKPKLTKVSKKKKEKNNASTKTSKKKIKNNKQNAEIGQNCEKTLKKFLKKKKQKEEELTERKKIHMEYFMYKDVCLPIENTEQRKIVFKIQLIDENAERKKKECIEYRHANQKRPSFIEVVKKDTACQNTDRRLKNIDYQCQTQYLPEPDDTRSSTQTSQPQKCFAETLSQLQFLFLPDQKNFSGFSKSQKAHYKQLLLYMAKKFDEPQVVIDEQTIQTILHDRYLKQRGITESYPKKGIPTHTSAIVSYVTNLFCFLEVQEKNNFIDRINCSYGYPMFQKLRRVKMNKSTKMVSQLISETTFWKFQAQLHDGLELESEIVQKALHSHNKAVFDAVNETLLEFQPYYSSQGQPFPWSYNYETTFYCISQSSYGALVCQVKDKIWQYSGTLAGILLEIDSNHPYKVHFSKILSIEQQMIQAEMKKYSDRVEVDENRTRVLCEIADFVQQEIIKEIGLLLLK